MTAPELTYCTNVHPGESLPRILDNLSGPVASVAREFSPGAIFPIGLWLPREGALALKHDHEGLDSLRETLERNRLRVLTLNVFPFGGFHEDRVKERVYQPSWLEERRLDYTKDAASVMASLLPERGFGTMSTLAGAHRPAGVDEDIQLRIAHRLRSFVEHAHVLEEETGRTIALCLEPEPWTTFERMTEIAMFLGDVVYRLAENVWSRNWGVTPDEARERVRRHLGVCFDLCHQAVMFEDPELSVDSLVDADVSVHKTQISNALEVREPHRSPETIDEIMAFDEPRYLHQTMIENEDGDRVFVEDLGQLRRALAENPRARRLRTHFHVPLDRETLGLLGTTRATIAPFLDAIRAKTDCRHFEVETYTWPVLPRDSSSSDQSLTQALPRLIVEELVWASQALGDVAPPSGHETGTTE